LARVSRWDLPDQLPSMVDRFGLLLGSGVRTMSKIKRHLENLGEVSMDEMEREGYQVVLEEKEETAWVKTITITNKAGVANRYWLYWNMGEGYRLEIIDGIGLPNLEMRPEFEYVLDCLTEERP
jgi:hypothetical protein